MAKTYDYRLAREKCAVRAAVAQDKEIKRLWLNLCDSYALLLKAETQFSDGALIRPLSEGVCHD